MAGLFLNAIGPRLASRSAVPIPAFHADSTQLDADTKLVLDESLSLVKAHCTACHSSQLIRQSHFSREKWTERIRWMQRTQKLWDLGPSEPAVLTYLTNYYGPVANSFDGRREPLNSIRWYPLHP